MENPSEFNIDVDRIVFAGDSAGGNIVAVLTQRLLKEKRKLPKLQVQLYPFIQCLTSKFPSTIHYSDTGLVGATNIKSEKFISWYLGIKRVTKEIASLFENDELISLAPNDEVKKKILSYIDVDKIPEKYKTGKSYYQTKARVPPKTSLSEGSVLKRDKQLAELFAKVLDPAMSPLLADDAALRGLPKAYVVIVEWDTFKDEGLLYAQRLKQAGVDVDVAFYEKAFHGCHDLPHVYPVSAKIQNDFIEYLKFNL
jgi:acetyl esterase/lipase